MAERHAAERQCMCEEHCGEPRHRTCRRSVSEAGCVAKRHWLDRSEAKDSVTSAERTARPDEEYWQGIIGVAVSVVGPMATDRIFDQRLHNG
jgi:hypothetical protein